MPRQHPLAAARSVSLAAVAANGCVVATADEPLAELLLGGLRRGRRHGAAATVGRRPRRPAGARRRGPRVDRGAGHGLRRGRQPGGRAPADRRSGTAARLRAHPCRRRVAADDRPARQLRSVARELSHRARARLGRRGPGYGRSALARAEQLGVSGRTGPARVHGVGAEGALRRRAPERRRGTCSSRASSGRGGSRPPTATSTCSCSTASPAPIPARARAAAGARQPVADRRHARLGGERIGLEPDELAIDELHVGTFKPKAHSTGRSRACAELARLGVTAIEVMPIGYLSR